MAPRPGFEGLADRSNWVRLRTLVILRWMAIGGQLAAILVAQVYFGIGLNLPAALLLVGLSALANVVSGIPYPENRRLSEAEALSFLLFDCGQLAALLFLSGGLTNPFALLFLAPTTIAATALERRATSIVVLLTLVLVSVLAVFHLPLRMQDGSIILVPPLFAFGFWLAIVIGVLFLALYTRRVSTELYAMSNALMATQMALAREQKLTELSGVVAAAAHELGTPLATIKLASSELADELTDRADLRADAELIREQANRCRDILHSMGRAGKDDRLMHVVPFPSAIHEAAEPHSQRKARLDVRTPDMSLARAPLVYRRPEIIHGLRNLVQNAVDFAHERVWIELDWTDQTIRATITDDGPGFPPAILGRIGDPFMRQRPDSHTADRPHYEGMGLGLFIAKTLLERTGARLTFSNASDPFLTGDERRSSGASVTVIWPRSAIEVDEAAMRGENRPVESP
ncbi:MAG: ActS/PrrB/RegB family redox-sensitive histidine kinase [Rhodobacteraceae bacterium]|nr:ActS/PrrB/RegB family redox-sensitive histidine kinase [Paracoccaceae bacterium]